MQKCFFRVQDDGGGVQDDGGGVQDDIPRRHSVLDTESSL
ncbi:hypothetical protein M947_07870 [Sulfurimonas hongkongensis]|uniref:Uncharacterized protein n=1 Tax=Sulfurimonas hongkongensis TaxID=1172190 RepID=T0KPM8_9BACT|nr:hypothetical protein M947_07870 [Sulfurimonas hongkongensis]